MYRDQSPCDGIPLKWTSQGRPAVHLSGVTAALAQGGVGLGWGWGRGGVDYTTSVLLDDRYTLFFRFVVTGHPPFIKEDGYLQDHSTRTYPIVPLQGKSIGTNHAT